MSNRKRVLVTGVSSGLGAAFARYYVNSHCEVIQTARTRDCSAIPVDLRRSETWNHPDLLEPFDLAIHCAALTQASSLESFYEINVVRAYDFFSHINFRTGGQLVNVSSTSVYGSHISGLVTELTPVAPSDDYGLSKFLFETLLSSLVDKSNGPSRCLTLRLPLVLDSGRGGLLDRWIASATQRGQIDVSNPSAPFNAVLDATAITGYSHPWDDFVTSTVVAHSNGDLTYLEAAEALQDEIQGAVEINVIQGQGPVRLKTQSRGDDNYWNAVSSREIWSRNLRTKFPR